MQDNNLEKNTDNLANKDSASDKDNGTMSLKQGKNALNLTQCQAYLDKLDKNTKVKVKILDFESFRAFLPFVNKYASKFEIFKYETSFEVVSVNNQKCEDTETKGFKESFTSWLSQQNVDPKIKEILEKELE